VQVATMAATTAALSMSSRAVQLRPTKGVARKAPLTAAPRRAASQIVCHGHKSSKDLFIPSSYRPEADLADSVLDTTPVTSIYAGGRAPPPAYVQERMGSVLGQLFHQRIVRLGGAVDDDMANLIVAQLLYLDSANPGEDIAVYVNSPGGSVTAGMAIFDTMRYIRPDCSTTCVGLAASMGAFLLSAGHKGKRYALPNSRIMIHQPLGGAQGQAADIEIQANEIMHHKATLSAYIAEFTGQSLSKIIEDTDRDFFMGAEDAMAYGLVDQVIANPMQQQVRQMEMYPKYDLNY